MDTRQPDAEPAVTEAHWPRRVEQAATADLERLLRAENRRRRGRWFAGGLVVVALGAVLTLLLISGMVQELSGPGTPPPDPDQRAAPASATVPMLDVSRPFASTPAADWADGAEGIVVPPAEAVAGFSAEQVAEATRLVRDVLVASRLEERMLVRHDPSAFLALLAPDAREQLEPLFGSGRESEVQSLVSLISSDSTLLDAPVKVNGTMTVSAGGEGELVVHTNYVFAYAFQPDEPTRLVEAMNAIVVVRADVDYVLRTGGRWTTGSQGLWYGDASGYGYSIACEAYRSGFLAPAATERSVTDESPREPTSFFDPESPLPAVTGHCHR